MSKMEAMQMTTQASTKIKTIDMAYVAVFTVLMIVCSWISIPAAVPFTLQTFGIFFAVGVLGGKRGTLAVLTYLLMGAVGLPVFSGFRGGIGSMFGSTGGYIIGFLFSALVMWGTESLLGRKKWGKALSMLLGLLMCYTFGTIWFMFVYTNSSGEIGVLTALSWCVFPYIIPDLLKIVLALTFCKRLSGRIKIN